MIALAVEPAGPTAFVGLHNNRREPALKVVRLRVCGTRICTSAWSRALDWGEAMRSQAIMRASSSGLGVVFMLLASALTSMATTDRTIQYQPEFMQLVQQGRVTDVTITSSPSGAMRIRATVAKSAGTEDTTVTVDGVPAGLTDDQLVNMLIEKGVRITHKPDPPSAFGVFYSVVPLIVVVVFWVAAVAILLWLAFRLVRAVERIAENTKR